MPALATRQPGWRFRSRMISAMPLEITVTPFAALASHPAVGEPALVETRLATTWAQTAGGRRVVFAP